MFIIEQISNLFYLLFVIFLFYLCQKYNIFNKANIYLKSVNIFNLIKRYEKYHNTKIIFIVDNFWNEKEYPLYSFLDKYIIDIDDELTFMKRFSEIKNSDNIDLIIHSTGGCVSSSDIITNILLQHKGYIKSFIPMFAFSAATHISLTADEIVMNKYSQLGPVDTQYDISETEKEEMYVGVNSIINIVKKKGLENVDDKYLLHYFEGLKYHEDSVRNLHRILDGKYSRRTVKKIINEFNNGDYPHSKPFNLFELNKIGLKVNDNVPYDINNIYNNFSALECLFDKL